MVVRLQASRLAPFWCPENWKMARRLWMTERLRCDHSSKFLDDWLDSELGKAFVTNLLYGTSVSIHAYRQGDRPCLTCFNQQFPKDLKYFCYPTRQTWLLRMRIYTNQSQIQWMTTKDYHIISQASNAWLKNPITEFRKFTSLLLVLLTLSMASNFTLSKGKHHQQTYNKTLSPYLERQAAYGRFSWN